MFCGYLIWSSEYLHVYDERIKCHLSGYHSWSIQLYPTEQLWFLHQGSRFKSWPLFVNWSFTLLIFFFFFYILVNIPGFTERVFHLRLMSIISTIMHDSPRCLVRETGRCFVCTSVSHFLDTKRTWKKECVTKELWKWNLCHHNSHH